MPDGDLPILDSRNAEACRRISDSSKDSELLLKRFEGGTLAGCVEYFLLNALVPSSSMSRREIRGNARRGIEPWASMVSTWARENQNSNKIFQPRTVEFKLINAEDWEGQLDDWHLFEQRFHSALLVAGFDSAFAMGLMRVFHELADNVIQHGNFGVQRNGGIASYHVEPRRFAFSIGDLGCGFLRSLEASPSWSHLSSDREALLAVIHKGASRREGQGQGEGFRLLWKSLADHGALVRIRSCGAAASIRPTQAGREAEVFSTPVTEGSHVSVCCSLGKPTAEDDIKFYWTPSLE